MEPLFIVSTVFDIYPDGGTMSLCRTFPNGGEARMYYDAIKVQGISTILTYSDYGKEFILCAHDNRVGEVYNRYRHGKTTTATRNNYRWKYRG